MATVVSGSRITVDDLVEIFETELTEAQLSAFVNSVSNISTKSSTVIREPLTTVAMITPQWSMFSVQPLLPCECS